MIKYFKNSPYKNIYILYFILSFLFYGNSLKNKYSLDDTFITVTNSPEAGKEYKPNQPAVAQGIKGIPKIWKSHYANDGEGTYDYRPFVTTTFAVEYAIFGQNPFISHLINIILYFLCVCVVHRAILQLFSAQPYKENLAFLCAFLFLIHPVHTEAVDNLKSRDELLSFLFGTLAMVYGFRFFDKKNIKDFVITGLCLLLGLFTKKTAVLAFVVIPMAFYFFRAFSLKKVLITVGALILIYISFILIKHSVLKEAEVRNFYHFENSLFIEKASLFTKMIIALKVLGFYIKMLFFPFPLRFYYGETMFDMSQGLNLYALVSIVFLAVSVWYFFKTKNKYFLFALLLFLGTIFPFLNFLTPVAGIIGDRLCFTASFGFCLLLSVVLITYFEKINFKKLSLGTFTKKPFVYMSLLSLVCLVYVVNRNSHWYDKLSLFSHDIIYMEQSSKGNSLLANEYYEKLNTSKNSQEATSYAERALKHYGLSIKADSSMFTACNNAGVVLFAFYKNYDEAGRFFKLAIRSKPLYPQAYENLANTFKMKSKYDTAIVLYRKAIAQNPQQYASYDAIGQAYSEQKKYKLAEQAYDTAIYKFPRDYYFTTQKANCVFMDGREAEGLTLFEEAFKLNPNSKLGNFIAQKFKLANNKEKETYYLNYNYYQ